MTSSDLQLRLGPVREAMLNLHRNLLDAERMAYERMHGRVPGSADVLQLAIHDPWFAWLRPLTALLVAMDEAMLEDSPDADARVPSLLDEARLMVRADEDGSDFQQRLFEFVQRSPDVAIAEVSAARLLR
ncbi:MAG: hypothetical protein ABIZ70_05490 [Gemmatimonadales bacterium]